DRPAETRHTWRVRAPEPTGARRRRPGAAGAVVPSRVGGVMNVYVAPIVEGQTEQGCVERLLHRVWGELLHRPERLQVLEPFRGQRDALVHPNGRVLTESVQKAFLKLQAKTRKDPAAQSLLLIM